MLIEEIVVKYILIALFVCTVGLGLLVAALISGGSNKKGP